MYEVVWPRGNKTTETTSFAKRLDTLDGKTIGELWNWVFRGDEIFPVIEKELAKRYPGIKFVSYETFGSMHGGEEGKALEDLSDKLQQNKCDAIIAGVGC
ncbi:hypothetical protein ACFLU2_02970 [Chloroflexota bacterium]